MQLTLTLKLLLIGLLVSPCALLVESAPVHNSVLGVGRPTSREVEHAGASEDLVIRSNSKRQGQPSHPDEYYIAPPIRPHPRRLDSGDGSELNHHVPGHNPRSEPDHHVPGHNPRSEPDHHVPGHNPRSEPDHHVPGHNPRST